MDLLPEKYVEGSVSSSRNIYELFNTVNGETAYGVLAALIGENINRLDSLAEKMSGKAADYATKKLYDKQHFDPKYGSFKNFWTRNIYLNPEKRNELKNQRIERSIITQTIAEYLLKNGVRAVQKWASEKDKLVFFEDIYRFLYSFSVYGEKNIDKTKSYIELSKIVNSFPISFEQKRNIKTTEKKIFTLEELADNSRFLSSVTDHL